MQKLFFIVAMVIGLDSCAISPSERASMKRVLVLNYVSPEPMRYNLSEFSERSKAPKDLLVGLKPVLDSAVQEIARERFEDILFLENPPPAPPLRPYFVGLSEVYGGFAKSMANQHHADAVMLILPRKGWPYGVSPSRWVQGIGIYHSVNNAIIEPTIYVLVINGKTGRSYGMAVAQSPSPIVSIPWKYRLNEYSDQERRSLLKAIDEGFSARISRTMDMDGFSRIHPR